MDFILAQIFGGIALILVCIGYFLKTKSPFMVMQIISNIFYASAFFVVGAYVGAGIVLISTFRCLYLYFAEKKNFKYTLHFLPVFIVLYIVTTILFWGGVYDFMPLVTSTMFTLAFTIKDLQKMRWVLIIPNSLLIVYNILKTTYMSAVLDFVEVVVIIIAIIKFSSDNKELLK